MKRLLSLCIALVLSSSLQAADVKTAAQEIVGAWQLDFTTPDDVHRTPIVIVGRQKDELVAWAVEDGEIQPFEKVALQGESLSLTIAPKALNGQGTVTLTARLNGEGACVGEGEATLKSGEKGNWTFRGTRMDPADFDEVSQWTLSFTTPDNEQHTATVMILTKSGRHYGWYRSDDFDLPAKEVTVQGDQVSFSLSAKAHGDAQVDVTFRGKVNGDQASGDASFVMDGQTGSFPFTAKRKS